LIEKDSRRIAYFGVSVNHFKWLSSVISS
jgi:hypothetical protein